MGVKDYGNTAAGNESGLFPEDQFPSTVNNGMRQVQADIRADIWEGIEWRDWGLTITYVAANQFRVSGDYSTVYHAKRRVQLTGTATGTIEGRISASTYSGTDTTVTVTWDSGSLSNDTDLVAKVGFAADTTPFGSNTGVPSGTRMLFQQSSVPIGWTGQTDYGDRAIRLAKDDSYTAPKLFVDGFTTVFTASRSTDAHTLTIAQMPAHDHFIFAASGAPATPIGAGYTQGPAAAGTEPSGGGLNYYIITQGGTVATTGKTDSVGSGDGHSHTIANMNLSYVDVLIGVKD